jgi:peptidoglycan/xylan/chitin deacetylase (PgdA/CDA1 family)
MGSAAWQLAGITAWIAQPRLWPPIVAALVADHVVLTAAGFVPRGRWLGPNCDRLPAADRQSDEVALTFDDGPDPDVTPKVLDLLDHAGARASFFCIGERAAAHPELVAEIARRGHRVENHSYSHPVFFSMLPPPALKREIMRAQDVLTAASGQLPRLFRAPAGFRSLLLDPVLHSLGLRFVSWTRRGFDKADGDALRVAQRVAGQAVAGDVLLLHDGAPARDHNGRPVVLEALPRVLDILAAGNLKGVPFVVNTTSGTAL